MKTERNKTVWVDLQILIKTGLYNKLNHDKNKHTKNDHQNDHRFKIVLRKKTNC